MLTLVVGMPGSGKGVYSMMLMEQFAQRRRQIYTNIQLRPACPAYKNAIFMTDEETQRCYEFVKNGSVLIVDECDLWLNAGDDKTIAKEWKNFVKLHRHRRIDIYMMAQCVENIYVRIRRMAQRVVVCEHNMRTKRGMQWLSSMFGYQRVVKMSSFIRGEFADVRLRKLVAEGGVGYREAQKYFTWYYTDQFAGQL